MTKADAYWRDNVNALPFKLGLFGGKPPLKMQQLSEEERRRFLKELR